MTTPPPDKQPAAETLETIAHRIVKRYLDDRINDHQLEQEFLSALRNERERCAKVADERAAFNHRLMRTHPIGDPMADLKSTRADEAEIVAGEIRENLNND